MRILSRIRLRTKFAMLMGLSALALVAVSGISAAQLHQRMIEDRVDKLQSLVLTVRGGAEYLEQQVQAGRLTRDRQLPSFVTSCTN
jgi:methyl-accepting chemotaxis protein